MAIVDVAKLRYSCDVAPIEEQERHIDDGTVLRGIHSRIGKTLGGSIEKSLGSMTSIVYEASQTVNSITYADFDGGPCTYEGFTWIDEDATAVEGIDFLFARIIEPVTSGQTPSVYITLDGGTTDLIKLSGIGDWCLIPLNNYIVQSAGGDVFLQVKAFSAITYAKIEWMVGKI